MAGSALPGSAGVGPCLGGREPSASCCGAGGGHAFSAHQGLGFALGGASLLILVLAWVSRAGRGALWLAGILVVQACLLQSLLDSLAGGGAAFGGLHALDGLLIVANTAVLYAWSRRDRGVSG